MSKCKLFICISVFLLFLTIGFPYNGYAMPYYEIALLNVTQISPVKVENSNIIGQDNTYTYEDKNISLDWSIFPNKFDIKLVNKTGDILELVWDKTVFIDIINGTSKRVIHNGVDFSERNKPQFNSIIIPNGVLKDSILPTDWISYKGKGSGLPSFLDANDYGKKELKQLEEYYIGKDFKILLTLISEKESYQYIFSFKINGYRLTK